MSSPFASRLGTNYCPTRDEIRDIQQLIAEPTRQIDSLNEAIAHLQKALEKLEQNRTDLETYVEKHKALISPIRRLPPEILSEIFILICCLSTPGSCDLEASLLLGSVCRSWRILSLEMPHLQASSRSDSPSSVEKEASLTQSSAIPVDGAWTRTILNTSMAATTRPDDQRKTAAPSNKRGFMSKFVVSRDNTPQTPSKEDPSLRFSRLSKRSKDLMRQLLNVDGESSVQVSMKWEHFTKVHKPLLIASNNFIDDIDLFSLTPTPLFTPIFLENS
ncbi:hypothetical protein R3P38DRAFT_3123731 [Favolaschia claudopus]|uniref:F-box domain-containing protein n=1 Tax=Favolaschia claudopus TaxID=2862362 RepID=A0AAV9ZCL2_9AGAR